MAITNCYITPDVFAHGETVTVHYTYQNDSTATKDVSYSSSLTTGFDIGQTSRIADSVIVTAHSPLRPGEVWEFTAVHTINLNFVTASYPISAHEYFKQSGVRSRLVYVGVDPTHVVGTVLNKRFSPSIAKFDIQRSDANGSLNDEGEYLFTTLSLAKGVYDSFPATVYYAQSPGVPKLPGLVTHPVHMMAQNTWAGYEASASSMYDDPDYGTVYSQAYRAFDRGTTVAWKSGARDSAPWIQLKMPQSLYDIKVTIANQFNEPVNGIVDGEVYGVDDAGALTLIGSFSGRNGTGSGAESTVECSNSDKAYHTVRIKVKKKSGSSFVAVGEMKITGGLVPADSIPSDTRAVQITDLQDLLKLDASGTNIIPGYFPNGDGWNFLLVFGDEYEQATASVGITRAFANLHLSGYPTGGACFGGFCTSTQDNPKLESHYPAHLYGGIAKIGNGWTPLTPANGTTPATYGGGVLRYRKIEDKCIIAGSVEVKPTSDTLVLADLPEGFVPAYNVFSLNACSGSRVARVAAYSNEDINTTKNSAGVITKDNRGKLALTWVWDMDDGKKYTSAAIWIQCSIEYWVDPPVEEVLLCGDAICGETTCGTALG